MLQHGIGVLVLLGNKCFMSAGVEGVATARPGTPLLVQLLLLRLGSRSHVGELIEHVSCGRRVVEAERRACRYMKEK